MKILMVCLGNICRSPLAEGIMKSKVPAGWLVDSAGTISQHEGDHPDKRAIKTAALHNIDISEQKSRPIIPADLDKFDRIFCMDLNNYEDVVSMAKNEDQRKKIALILEAAGRHDGAEVPDPYWGGMEDFEKVYQMLDSACTTVAKDLVPKS